MALFSELSPSDQENLSGGAYGFNPGSTLQGVIWFVTSSGGDTDSCSGSAGTEEPPEYPLGGCSLISGGCGLGAGKTRPPRGLRAMRTRLGAWWAFS